MKNVSLGKKDKAKTRTHTPFNPEWIYIISGMSASVDTDQIAPSGTGTIRFGLLYMLRVFPSLSCATKLLT